MRSLVAFLIVLAPAVARAQQAAERPDLDPKSGSEATYLGTTHTATTSSTGAVATDTTHGTLAAAGGATSGAIAVASDNLARDQPDRVWAREPAHPPAGLGGDFVLGWAGQRGGKSGYVARFEYEVLPVFQDTGGVVGFHEGFEWWRSGADNWGFSMPVAMVFGARVEPVRATIGFGMDAILIDQVDDDTGFGMLAPFATARLGLDISGFEIAADARLGYRWQFGAPDHTRWQLGIAIGHTWSMSKVQRPIY